MNEVRAAFLSDGKDIFKHVLLLSAYLAAVNAACERAPMIYSRAVSDGQFYSPPESVAGDLLDLVASVVMPEPVD